MTCGAVKALGTMAAAVNLRTPLIGVRVSRAPGAGGRVCGSTPASSWAAAGRSPPPTKFRTSSRVISPRSPVPVTASRSTPRSLASLRTGGVDRGRSRGTVARRGQAPVRVRPPDRLNHGRGRRTHRQARPPGQPQPRQATGAAKCGCAGRAAGAFEDGAVADEVRLPLGGAASPRRHRRRQRAVVALDFERNDRLAHLHHRARLLVQGRDHAGERRGKFDDGLGRLHLRDDLVERDGVPHRDLPGDDFRFSETLTEIREPEFLDHGGGHPSSPLRELGRPSARSTPSRIRSRPGRWCISSFEYGYGTSKPVTRTGAASRW